MTSVKPLWFLQVSLSLGVAFLGAPGCGGASGNGVLLGIDGATPGPAGGGSSAEGTGGSVAPQGGGGITSSGGSAGVDGAAAGGMGGSGGNTTVNCGQPGTSCCDGNSCNGGGCCVSGICMGPGASCVGLGSGICNAGACGNCGGPGLVCCGSNPATGACTAPGTICSAGTCIHCGNLGAPCCVSASGGTGTCSGPNAICTNGVCLACGIPGSTCCPGNRCDSPGCCYNNTCAAEGNTCGSSGGTCQAGRCSGCGSASQPCCSNLCYDGLLCKSGTCTSCGGSGQACCPTTGGGAACQTGMACTSSGSDGVCARCGGVGDTCCPGKVCNDGCCSGDRCLAPGTAGCPNAQLDAGPPDAPAGGGGAPGTGGAGGAGGAGTGGAGTGGTTVPDASIVPDTALCVPGETQCLGNGVQSCSPSGQWQTAVACSSPLVCRGGACVSAPPSCPGAFISDDFSGAALDAAKWRANLSVPQGNASVVQIGGHVEITNRGYLGTLAQFVPAAGGVRVTGKWTFDAAAAADDLLQVLTRTDGVPAGEYGEAQAGIECFATMVTGAVQVRAWGTTLSNAANSGSLAIKSGDTIGFEMTDDGSLVTCAFVNLTGGAHAKASASAAFAPTTNRIAFHDREFEGATRRSLVDDLVIESGFVNRPTHHYLFEEASGASAYDLPGTADGTLGAGASRVAAILGPGVSFAGTNDGYVELGTAGSALGTSNFTIAFWFNVSHRTHLMDLFGNRVNGSHGNFLQIRMNADGSVSLELDQDTSGTNYQAVSSVSPYDDSQWHHLAVRRQGLALALFIDGVLVASNTRTTGTPTDLSSGTALRLGSSAIASTYALATTGSFDDVRVYGSALGDCDIALIAMRP